MSFEERFLRNVFGTFEHVYLEMSETQKKVFILVADPEVADDTPTRKVVKATESVLNNATHSITKTDLSRDGWLDVLSTRDFTQISDPYHVNFRDEQEHSQLIQKIQDEQTKLLQCDMFLIFATLSWFGVPSHFYAWWERVVTLGRCYGPGAIFDQGCFKGKKTLVVVVGPGFGKYSRDTLNGSMEEVLYPITHGMLYQVGFSVYRSQPIYTDQFASMEEACSKWQRLLRNMEADDRLQLNFNKPVSYTNWTLNTNEKERKNDLEMVAQQGDMSLAEADKATFAKDY